MKEFRRDEARRIALKQRAKGITNPLGSGSKLTLLSTPLRELHYQDAQRHRTPTSQAKLRKVKGSYSDYVCSGSLKTPVEIRWPLIVFFQKHGYDDSYVRLVGNDSIAEQHKLLADLESIEQSVNQIHSLENTLRRSEQVDWDVLNELKAQYVRAALRDSGPTAESLRSCLLQFLASCHGHLRQSAQFEQLTLPETASLRQSAQLELPTLPETACLRRVTAQEMQITELAASSKLRTPSPANIQTPPKIETPGGGDTPLNVIRQRALTLKRLRILRMGVCDPHVLARAKELVAQLETTGNSMSGGKRLSSETNTDGKRRRFSFLSSESTAAPPTLPEKHEKAQGAADLLGVKPVAASKKRYISRISVNQKARCTRETRALRTSLHQSGAHEQPVNKTKRQRKTDHLKQIQQDKFVTRNLVTLQDVQNYYHVKDKADWSHLFGTNYTDKCQLRDQLNTFFELEDFRPGQYDAIVKLLDSEEIKLLVSLPTGSGKSLIFQMAALNIAKTHKALSVVVFPTLPLLTDQLQRLQRILCISVDGLHSGLEPDHARKVLGALKYGILDCVLVTPEQYISTRFQTATRHPQSRPINLLCIDEAHCLSEWGHTFRPAYQQLFARVCKIPRILLMTATANQATLSSMQKYLGDRHQLHKPFEETQRSDLHFCIIPVGDSTSHLPTLLTLVERMIRQGECSRGMTIIYCWMKYMATKVATALIEHFAEASTIYYHSGLDSEERARAMASFVEGRCRFCVATEALGIGIDSSHVAAVIHYNLPSCLEQYTQETGRCNRSGKHCQHPCYLLLSESDFRSRHQQMTASALDSTAIMATFRSLLRYQPSDKISLQTRGSKMQQRNSPHARELSLQLKNSDDSKMVSKKLTNTQVVVLSTPLDGAQVAVLSAPSISQSSSPSDKSEFSDLSTALDRQMPTDVQCLTVCIDSQLLGLMFNSRSDDDVRVLLALIDSSVTSETLTIRMKADASSDRLLSIWDELTAEGISLAETSISVIREEQSVDTAFYKLQQTSRLKIQSLHSEGIEIRCYARPLEDYISTHTLVKFIAPYWTKSASGIYKVKWIDVLSSAPLTTLLLDLEWLENSLFEIAHELHLSVLPIMRNKRIWLRFIHIAKNSTTHYLKDVIGHSINVLQHHHYHQVNRLLCAFSAFKLGASNVSSMRTFIEDYYNWPTSVWEAGDTFWNNDSFTRYEMTPLQWVANCYDRKPQNLHLAQLKFDIEKLISSLSRDGRYTLCETNHRSEARALTSITLARILTGVGSLSHHHGNSNHIASWGAYQGYEFEYLREICHRVLKKVVQMG